MSDELQTADRPAVDGPTPAETTVNARRRGQALAGALAGLAVILVLVGVFVGIKVSDDDKSTPAAAPPPAEQPAQTPPSAVAPSPSAPPDAQAPPEQPQQPAQPETPKTPPALAKRPAVTAGSGKLTKLSVKTLVKGTGPKVRTGQTILTNYVLVTYADGKVIQATWDMGQAVPLTVGSLIPGFDQGIIGVPVGSRVQLDIPAAMAYGENPTGGEPAGDLRFVVDVLAAQ